jgi:tetratricopeptide (TPR) repeat protein
MAIVLLATLARADEDKAQARAFFRTATQHYDLGEFAEALHDFKEAYRNFEDPSFLFNIGQCHRQLGQNEPAVRFFKVYLSKVPDAPNKAEVRDLIAKLEVAIAEERRAQTGKPQGTMESQLPREPSPAPASTAPAVVVAPTPAPVVVAPKADKPVYKKWWLWTAVVVVVAAGVGIGLGVGLPQAPSAHTDFGTFKPY